MKSGQPQLALCHLCKDPRRAVCSNKNGVICAACESVLSRTKCKGCGAACDASSAVVTQTGRWHTSCYNAFHSGPSPLPFYSSIDLAVPSSQSKDEGGEEEDGRSSLSSLRGPVVDDPLRAPHLYTPLLAEDGPRPPAGVSPSPPPVPAPGPPVVMMTLPGHLGAVVQAALGMGGGQAAGHGVRGAKAYLYGPDLPPARPFTSFTLEHLLLRAQAMGLVRDRVGRFKTYPRCCAGAELVDYMLWCRQAGSREQGVAIGHACVAAGLLVPVGVAPLPVPHGPSAVLPSPGQLPAPFTDSHTALYSVLLRRRRSPLDGVLPEGSVAPASAYVLGLQGPPLGEGEAAALPTTTTTTTTTSSSTLPAPPTATGAQVQGGSGPQQGPAGRGRKKKKGMETAAAGGEGGSRQRGEGVEVPDLLPHTPPSPRHVGVGSLQQEEVEEGGSHEAQGGTLLSTSAHSPSHSATSLHEEEGGGTASGAVHPLPLLPAPTGMGTAASATGPLSMSVAHSVAESADLHLLPEGRAAGGGVGGLLSPPSAGGEGEEAEASTGGGGGGSATGSEAGENEDEVVEEEGMAVEALAAGVGTGSIAPTGTPSRARTGSSGGAGMTSRFAGAVAFFRGKGGGAGTAPASASKGGVHHRPEDWLESMDTGGGGLGGARGGQGAGAGATTSTTTATPSKPPLPLSRTSSSRSVSIAKPRYPYPYPYQPEPAAGSGGAGDGGSGGGAWGGAGPGEGVGPSPSPAPSAGLAAGQGGGLGSVPSSVEGGGALPGSYSAGGLLPGLPLPTALPTPSQPEGEGGGAGEAWRVKEKEALLALRAQLLSTVWREGWLVKEGHVVRNWKRRWFSLKGSSLAYYKGEGGGAGEALGVLDIREYTLEKALGNGPRTSTSLRLCPKHDLGQEYVIDCVASGEFVAWVKALGQAMGAWEGLSARAGRLEMARAGGGEA